jgi:MG2 domain
MRCQSSCILKAVFVCLFFVSASHAQTGVLVKESSVRILFVSNSAAIDLPVENQTRDTITAHILLELLEPSGITLAHSEQDVSLPPGVTKLSRTLPLASALITKTDRSNLLWYRLRYTITPGASANSLPSPLTGILSVGEATRGIFELHVATPEFVRESGHYALRVRAIHPVSGRPVSGVAVQASLDVNSADNKPLVTKTTATDRRGFATLPFTLPQAIDASEVDVTVTGKLGDYSTKADDSFQVAHFSNVSISTDKPIYQPGQALHMRLMAFDTNKKAIAAEPVILKLLDPDDTLVYRARLANPR